MRPGGQSGGIGGGRAGGREPLSDEKRLRLAVPQDVGDLRRREMPVDRREVPAGLKRGEVQLKRGSPVRQERRDAVTGDQAEIPQTTGQLIHPGQQVPRAVLAAVDVDCGDPARILLRATPEAERCHRHLLGVRPRHGGPLSIAVEHVPG